MTLSIGVSPGSRIQIGASVLSVVDTRHGTITARVGKGPEFLLTDLERTEVLPSVFVFVGGHNGQSHGMHRLAFEAPREISINRIPGEASA